METDRENVLHNLVLAHAAAIAKAGDARSVRVFGTEVAKWFFQLSVDQRSALEARVARIGAALVETPAGFLVLRKTPSDR